MATVHYLSRSTKAQQDSVTFDLWPAGKAAALPLGMARGQLLVDEITTLKKAAELHLNKNDQEGAYRLVHALRRRFEQSGVSGLDKELKTIARLDETFTKLSGHKGEPTARVALPSDSVTGLPR